MAGSQMSKEELRKLIEEAVKNANREVTDEERQDFATRISRSKINLILAHLFFGHLAVSTEVKLSYKMPTAWTDGSSICFNPDFFRALSDKELSGVMVHEILHIALDHPRRAMGKMDKQKYLVVCDILINEWIRQSNKDLNSNQEKRRLDLPADGAFFEEVKWTQHVDAGFVMQSSADTLYELIDGDSVKQFMGNNVIMEDLMDAIPGTQAEAEGWIGRLLAAAEEAKKSAGSLPAGIEQAVDKIRDPQKNWLEILYEFVSETDDDYGYAPPDRRFSEADFIQPDINSESVISKIVLAIDTSGSISDRELEDFFSEVYHIARLSNGVIVCYCDAEVQYWGEMESGDRPPKPKGRGGTAFHPVFERIQKEVLESGETIVGVVYFTDGYPYQWPDEAIAQGIPTLWVINNNDIVPPWGRHVKYLPQTKERY